MKPKLRVEMVDKGLRVIVKGDPERVVETVSLVRFAFGENGDWTLTTQGGKIPARSKTGFENENEKGRVSTMKTDTRRE